MGPHRKPSRMEDRITPAEVEMVLRHAAELSARRRGSDTLANSISPEVLVQVAAALGIAESDVRRALSDLVSDKAAEPDTLAFKLYGSARIKTVREIESPAEPTRTHLEELLQREQSLKLRRKTEAISLWDAGDVLGTVRRALDFSGHYSLLKVRSVELRVEDVGYGRSGARLIADVSNQRGEYLSLGGILGATLALPLAIAGVYDWLYFLAVIPALAAPGAGFRLAYQKSCADIRRALDSLLDAAEEGPPREGLSDQPRDRKPGQIQGLKPIPKFTQPSNE
ncbi:MAG: hypothetical protein AVDCRST_MAG14-2410 [uncultured Rubrobacteraceae bacterium]|uniref:Uncharacterized protein n=1 Tax=uncultured Rubrobacteraceae bacterium TaxID=349277 RepID=A0A6J4R0Q9_9ACTN|nr:MAG: hypothetical protein AVDCRST_MAG14-2410 [uncultured Rubrobacteraceae bacterium]